MSSHDLEEVESHKVERSMSEPFNGTIDTLESDPNSDLNSVLDTDIISTNGDEPGSHRLHEKSRTMHTPNSPVEAPSDNNNDDDDDDLNSDKLNVSNYSDDHKETKYLQSSQSRTYPEKLSPGGHITTKSEEYLTNMLPGISDYVASRDEFPSSPTSEPVYYKYRKSGPDLTTLHMFTGMVNGNTPVYVPVYKRNTSGKLLKLMKDLAGRWGYQELSRLSEEEIEGGLKILKKPKAYAVPQSSKIEESGGRRTLADFGPPDTNSKGGRRSL